MTIGIAIPTYNNHLIFLNELLTQISKSTILPKQVSISISSFDGDLNFGDYPFELIITKTLDFKNPSENRNIAASKLSTDIISFIDGDDIPHIKRNEYLLKSFELGSKIVVHHYEMGGSPQNTYDNPIDDLILQPEYIDTFVDDKHYPYSSNGDVGYHNAHITLFKNIFDDFKYNENPSFFKIEDSEFTSRLVKNGFKLCYIQNKLSVYRH